MQKNAERNLNFHEKSSKKFLILQIIHVLRCEREFHAADKLQHANNFLLVAYRDDNKLSARFFEGTNSFAFRRNISKHRLKQEERKLCVLKTWRFHHGSRAQVVEIREEKRKREISRIFIVFDAVDDGMEWEIRSACSSKKIFISYIQFYNSITNWSSRERGASKEDCGWQSGEDLWMNSVTAHCEEIFIVGKLTVLTREYHNNAPADRRTQFQSHSHIIYLHNNQKTFIPTCRVSSSYAVEKPTFCILNIDISSPRGVEKSSEV